MTPTDDSDDLTLPVAFFDDGPSELEQALRAGLKRDEPGLSPRTVRNHRQALAAVLPAVEHAGVFTLNQLNDDEGLLAVRSALAQAIEDSPNEASTWLEYLRSFATRCESAGMLRGDANRLQRALVLALKAAGKPAEPEPEVTDDHLRALHGVMLAWRDAPTERHGSNGCHERLVGVIGYRKRPVTPPRRDRALAAVAITLSGVPRTGDVVRLTRGDVRGSTIRTQLRKGAIVQPVVTFELASGLGGFVRPLLARVGSDPDSPLFDGGDQVLGDVRAILLSAGWPEHHGRVGLHRLRKAFIRVNYEDGRSAGEASAGLTNSPPVAERAYAIHTRSAQRSASFGPWMRKLHDLTEPAPAWRWPDWDHEPIPWESLPASAWVANPLSGAELIRRANRTDLRKALEFAVTQLGVDPEDITDDWPEKLAGLEDAELSLKLSGAWRLRWVEVEEALPHGGTLWQQHVAFESNVGDVLVINYYVPGPTDELPGNWLGHSRPLWLERGDLHRHAAAALASDWYECRDLNPGSGVGNAR